MYVLANPNYVDTALPVSVLGLIFPTLFLSRIPHSHVPHCVCKRPMFSFKSWLLPLLDPCSFSLFSAFGPTKEASSCSHKTACARKFFLPSVVRDFKCVSFGCRSCTPIIRACRPLCCFPLFLFGARRPLLFPLLLFVSPELPQHSITTACATAPASSSLCITGYIAVVPLNLYGHYLFVLMRKKEEYNAGRVNTIGMERKICFCELHHPVDAEPR